MLASTRGSWSINANPAASTLNTFFLLYSPFILSLFFLKTLNFILIPSLKKDSKISSTVFFTFLSRKKTRSFLRLFFGSILSHKQEAATDAIDGLDDRGAQEKLIESLNDRFDQSFDRYCCIKKSPKRRNLRVIIKSYNTTEAQTIIIDWREF